MAIQPMQLYNDAYEDLYIAQTLDWEGATNVAAILCTNSYSINAFQGTYGDVTHECTDADYDPEPVADRVVDRDSDRIRYRHARIDWGSNVTISARYIVFVVGDPANLQAGDRVIGVVDLGETKSAVADTDNSTFAFTPALTGLWNVLRS